MLNKELITIFHEPDSSNNVSDVIKEVFDELIFPSQKITINQQKYEVIDQNDQIKSHMTTFDPHDQYIRHIYVKKI